MLGCVLLKLFVWFCTNCWTLPVLMSQMVMVVLPLPPVVACPPTPKQPANAVVSAVPPATSRKVRRDILTFACIFLPLWHHCLPDLYVGSGTVSCIKILPNRICIAQRPVCKRHTLWSAGMIEMIENNASISFLPYLKGLQDDNCPLILYAVRVRMTLALSRWWSARRVYCQVAHLQSGAAAWLWLRAPSRQAVDAPLSAWGLRLMPVVHR